MAESAMRIVSQRQLLAEATTAGCLDNVPVHVGEPCASMQRMHDLLGDHAYHRVYRMGLPVEPFIYLAF
jgi:hypothetical protein